MVDLSPRRPGCLANVRERHDDEARRARRSRCRFDAIAELEVIDAEPRRIVEGLGDQRRRALDQRRGHHVPGTKGPRLRRNRGPSIAAGNGEVPARRWECSCQAEPLGVQVNSSRSRIASGTNATVITATKPMAATTTTAVASSDSFMATTMPKLRAPVIVQRAQSGMRFAAATMQMTLGPVVWSGTFGARLIRCSKTASGANSSSLRPRPVPAGGAAVPCPATVMPDARAGPPPVRCRSAIVSAAFGSIREPPHAHPHVREGAGVTSAPTRSSASLTSAPALQTT